METTRFVFANPDDVSIESYIRDLVWHCAQYEHNTDVIKILTKIKDDLSVSLSSSISSSSSSSSAQDAVNGSSQQHLSKKQKKKKKQQEVQHDICTECSQNDSQRDNISVMKDTTQNPHIPLVVFPAWDTIHTTISLPVANKELMSHMMLIGTVLEKFTHCTKIYTVGSSVNAVFFDTPFCDIDVVLTDEHYTISHIANNNMSYTKIEEFRIQLIKIGSAGTNAGICGSCCNYTYKIMYDPSLVDSSIPSKSDTAKKTASFKFKMNIKDNNTGRIYNYKIDLSNRVSIHENWNGCCDFGFLNLKFDLGDKKLLIESRDLNSFMAWRLNEPQETGPTYVINFLREHDKFAMSTMQQADEPGRRKHKNATHVDDVGVIAVKIAKRFANAVALRSANLENGIMWNMQCPVCMTSSADDAAAYMKTSDISYKTLIEYMMRLVKVCCPADARHVVCLNCLVGSVTSNPDKELTCTLCRAHFGDGCMFKDPFVTSSEANCRYPNIEKMLKQSQAIGWNITQWLHEKVKERKPFRSTKSMMTLALRSLFQPSDQSGEVQRAETERDGVIGAADEIPAEDDVDDFGGSSSDED